jgi:hypothetical protein
LQYEVLEKLYADPDVPAANIGVEVDGGVVTLTGTVDNLDQGLAAECCAIEVHDVLGVTNDIEVREPVRKRSVLGWAPRGGTSHTADSRHQYRSESRVG